MLATGHAALYGRKCNIEDLLNRREGHNVKHKAMEARNGTVIIEANV